MTTAMITNKARRPALDMEALALHYRVPASTLRGWAKADQWRRYPDPAPRHRRGRPRVLFDLDDADRSYWTRVVATADMADSDLVHS
jgi:hypothetical protein